MKREDLEHIIRAAGDVLGESEVIIVGSQAIPVLRMRSAQGGHRLCRSGCDGHA